MIPDDLHAQLHRTSPETIDARPPELIIAQRQTTEQIEPKRAFEYWRNTALARVDASCTEEVRVFAAGRLFAASEHGALMHTRSSGVQVERRDRHVRADGVDDVCVSLLLAGRAYHEQCGRGGIVETGGLGFTAMDRPFVSGLPGPYEEIRLHVPRVAFVTQVGSLGSLAGRTMPGGTPLADLLAGYLRSFAGSIERMSDVEAAHGFAAVLHLLRGMVDPDVGVDDAELSVAGLRSLAGAYIERRLHDPTLSPEEIRRALKVSRTRLYEAFAADGGIAAAVRDARLDRAHRRLASRDRSGPTVTAVMLSCGYLDGSVFSRAFKSRFGLAPRDLRETAAPRPA